MTAAPLFIVFEGIDGSGTTTQCDRLSRVLESRGHLVVSTREPGGTLLGERVRDILLDPALSELDHLAELLLYGASRRQHVAQLIAPALDAGKPVISDRYTSSSLAYQGVGRGLGAELVSQINALATNGLEPDITVYLDLDVGTAEARRLRRSDAPGDRIEQAGRKLQEAVRSAYLALAQADRTHSILVDALPTAEVVAEGVLVALERQFPKFPYRA